MQKNIRLAWLFTQTAVQSEFQYRLGSLLWVINGAITPMLLMAVWLVVGSVSTLPMNQSEIATYYLLSLLVTRITQVWSIENMGEMIRSGEFSQRLIRPYYFLLEELGDNLAHKIIRLTTLFPVFVILWILLSKLIKIEFTLSAITLFIFALLMGLVVRFYFANLLALLVFWLEEAQSIDQLHELFLQAFSGSLIPLALAPAILGPLILYSPFRYYVSFPIEIALGRATGDIAFQGFLFGGFYLILFYLLHKLFLNLALKKYGAYGG